MEERIVELENTKSTKTLLERKSDNESYQRRFSLRVFGKLMSQSQKKESEDECVRKVKNEVEKVEANMSDMDIDRAHRIGPIKKDGHGREIERPMIVRFTSWRVRTNVYRGRKKRGNVRYYIDLTKRRFHLKENCHGED